MNTKKIEYKWVIAALCFVMIFVGLGFVSSTRSLFVVPVTEALGISRSAFSFNDSIRFVSTAITNLFFGIMVAKFGARKLIGAGFLSLCAATVCFTFAQNVIPFYIGSALLGIGFSWGSTTIVSYVINRWFTEKKGTVMGAVLAANGIGGAVATQILTPIIHAEGDGFGYRNAYRLLTILLLAVGVIFVLLFREKAHNETQPATKKRARGRDWVGVSFATATRSWFFYGAAVCIFLTGIALQGMFGITAAHLTDVGFDSSFVATVMSVMSLSMTVFKFLTGVFYDKWGLRTTVTLCSATGVVTVMIFALLTPTPTGAVMAVCYGIFSALAMPLETIVIPLYASDLFGQKSFDHILGVLISINTAGFALASPFLNFVYGAYGSYKPALMVCSGAMVIVVVLLQFVISSAHKIQRQVMEEAL